MTTTSCGASHDCSKARNCPSSKCPSWATNGHRQRRQTGGDPAEAVAKYHVLLNKKEGDAATRRRSPTTCSAAMQEKLSATVQQGMEANKAVFLVPGSTALAVFGDGEEVADSTWTRQAGEGRESLPASDEEKALFGNGKATSTMKVTYVNVVALWIQQVRISRSSPWAPNASPSKWRRYRHPCRAHGIRMPPLAHMGLAARRILRSTKSLLGTYS